MQNDTCRDTLADVADDTDTHGVLAPNLVRRRARQGRVIARPVVTLVKNAIKDHLPVATVMTNVDERIRFLLDQIIEESRQVLGNAGLLTFLFPQCLRQHVSKLLPNDVTTTRRIVIGLTQILLNPTRTRTADPEKSDSHKICYVNHVFSDPRTPRNEGSPRDSLPMHARRFRSPSSDTGAGLGKRGISG